MLNINNLTYGFPQKDLYEEISFTLEAKQHCAFIGTSGSGKTTLIDMIINPDDYMYDGKLELEENSRIGYVSQFSQLDKSNEATVFGYIADEFITLKTQIEAICVEMETSTHNHFLSMPCLWP
jgi:ATP-binding cassette subfamily F protein 3